MIFEGLTLAEYLAPRMKRDEPPKRKRIEDYYIKNGGKPLVCAMVVGCSERWACHVIGQYKKAAVG